MPLNGTHFTFTAGSALISIGAFPYNPNAASEADTYCINNFRRSAKVRPSKVITQVFEAILDNNQSRII